MTQIIRHLDFRPEENSAKRKTEMRMRQTQIDTQSKRFYDIWNDYNSNPVMNEVMHITIFSVTHLYQCYI